jgi:hypothetical protein
MMGKYEPLGVFLRSQKQARIPMTFAQIERILKAKLPMSKKQRAWWSNNPDNNVMTREWLDAGFETEAVDLAAEKLVFRKQEQASVTGKRHSIFGCMKGLITLAEGYDPAAPMDLEDDWDAKYSGPGFPR